MELPEEKESSSEPDASSSSTTTTTTTDTPEETVQQKGFIAKLRNYLARFFTGIWQRLNEDPPSIDSSDYFRKLRYLFSPRINFFWLHFSYIVSLSFLGGFILWVFEDSISFIDGLFLSTSSATVTGLATYEPSKLSVASKLVILLWNQLGGVVTLSLAPPVIKILHLRRLLKSGAPEDLISFETKVLTVLICLVIFYTIVFQIVAFLALGIFLSTNSWNPEQKAELESNTPWFWALFTVMSAFSNSGFTITTESFITFRESWFLLATVGLLIVAGNTCYPIFLRGLVWMAWYFTDYRMKKSPQHAEYWQEYNKALHSLLQRPRQYFTHMYPKVNKNISFDLIDLLKRE
jgi:Trk-type K+ transport system membrane component